MRFNGGDTSFFVFTAPCKLNDSSQFRIHEGLWNHNSVCSRGGQVTPTDPRKPSTAMDALQGGWFSEINEQWPGQALSLQTEEVLHTQTSAFQDISVLKSKAYGTVLVIDGAIQCTTRDEFSYHEALAHTTLNSHPCPKNVLVVGGGDGGIVREVLKHASVESVMLCEIDEAVIAVARKYLPDVACGLDDPRVRVVVGDGCAFVADASDGSFDVVITDSSDPVGPASGLFGRAYYESVRRALRPDGIMCAQGESVWLHLDLLRTVVSCCKEFFPTVAYAQVAVPTYPCGGIGFVLASNARDVAFATPLRTWTGAESDALGLRYYSADVHRASFALPRFAQTALGL